MPPIRVADRLDVSVPDLSTYSRIIVAFSGGKDSLAALLAVIDGLARIRRDPRGLVELWHHDVDGGESFMDWPVTTAYCQAVADAFGLPLYQSFKVGGILGEMNRDNTPTAPTRYQDQDGTWHQVGGAGKPGTRGLFPQVSPDLRVRWCSAYVKIDVMDRAICGQARFQSGRSLVVTGERAAESSNRARYATFEPHRTDTRNGTRRTRHIDHWRPVHAWTEQDVWDVIQLYGVVPHVAYQLGWGRLSCLSCIFGSDDQWATIGAIFPDHLERVAVREEQSGKTIHRTDSVRQRAARGTPYPAALARPDLVAVARSHAWSLPVLVDPAAWTLPAGAYGESNGPS